MYSENSAARSTSQYETNHFETFATSLHICNPVIIYGKTIVHEEHERTTNRPYDEAHPRISFSYILRNRDYFNITQFIIISTIRKFRDSFESSLKIIEQFLEPTQNPN